MRPAIITYRHQYDMASEEDAQLETVAINDDPSLTEQHHAKDADLNEILRRFGVTDGAIPPSAMDPRHFGDFTDAVDFREALDRTRIAAERFNALPADIRNRFANSPVLLWQFVNDPRNHEEAVRLGLLKKTMAPREGATETLSEPPAST